MPKTNIEQLKEKIYEQLADIEHQRWSDWQKYMHSKMEPDGREFMLLPYSLFTRWERQIHTNYSELSEHEKQSDRDQVDRYWLLIDSLIDQAIQARNEELVELAKKLKKEELFVGETQYRYDKGNIAWVFNQAIEDIINLINKEK